MEIENELKYLVPLYIDENDIFSMITKNFNISSINNISNEDTYYDDEKKTLKENNSIFRIRKVGNKTIITYKQEIENDTAIKRRLEYEVKIDSSEEISLESAIQYLKTKYPDIKIPNNLSKQLTIFNKRKTCNLLLNNSTVELALDSLSTYNNADNTQYVLDNELEFELKKGDINALETINSIITENLPMLHNNFNSKYSRALKTINGEIKTLSPQEVALCYIISSIISSEEFNSLKNKTQMFTDHSKPTPENLLLNKYINPKVLMQDIIDAKNMNVNTFSQPKDISELFKSFFSDINYNKQKNIIEQFFNDNFYCKDSIITNRYTHSLQVMIISMLIAKRFNINNNLLLLTSASALFHDIGHVPFSHECEKILNLLDGSFSHEQNGVSVIDKISRENFKNIISDLENFYSQKSIPISKKELSNFVTSYLEELKLSISSHSTKRCIDLPKGQCSQIPRLADKVYSFSDALDILHLSAENLFDKKNSLDRIIDSAKNCNKTKLSKIHSLPISESFTSSLDTLDLNSIEKYLNKINEYASTGNYGRIPILIADSVIKTTHFNNDGSSFVVLDSSPEMWHIINSLKKSENLFLQNNSNAQIRKKTTILVTIVFSALLNQQLEKNQDLEKAYNNTIEEFTKLNTNDLFTIAHTLLENFENRNLNLDIALKNLRISLDKLHLLNFYEHQLKLPIDKTSPEKIMQALNVTDYTTNIITQNDTYFDNNNYLLNNHSSLCIRKASNKTQTMGIYKTFSQRNNRYIARKSSKFVLPDNASAEDLYTVFNNPEIVLPKDLKQVLKIDSTKKIYEFSFDNELVTITLDLNSTNPKSLEILANSEQILTKIRALLKKNGIDTKPSTFFDTALYVGINKKNNTDNTSDQKVFH